VTQVNVEGRNKTADMRRLGQRKHVKLTSPAKGSPRPTSNSIYTSIINLFISKSFQKAIMFRRTGR